MLSLAITCLSLDFTSEVRNIPKRDDQTSPRATPECRQLKTYLYVSHHDAGMRAWIYINHIGPCYTSGRDPGLRAIYKYDLAG